MDRQTAQVITLLTDFGAADTYVAQMKGAILSINPAATIVDISHDVSPQDVFDGALRLEASYGYFPKGSVHVAVVDPGVGGERKAIVVRTGSYHFVAPDNGILSFALSRESVLAKVELSRSEYHRATVSDTFHGRDIFAPAAAHLSLGVPLANLGDVVEGLLEIDIPEPEPVSGGLRLHVIHVDRFGNLVTDLAPEALARAVPSVPASMLRIEAGGRSIRGLRRSYSHVRSGEPLAIWGSAGRLEIAVRTGNAAATLGLRVGSTVLLRFPEEPSPA